MQANKSKKQSNNNNTVVKGQETSSLNLKTKRKSKHDDKSVKM